MDEREKIMLERLKPERHISAMMTLATIKYIKEECKKAKRCESCRFFNEKEKYYNTCILAGNEDLAMEDWDEYDIVERIYK